MTERGSSPPFTIVDLGSAPAGTDEQVANLIQHTFAAYADPAAAAAEVHESLGEGRISRVALAEDGSVLGWVGGIPEYDGLAWELHPLAVEANYRRRGIGRALVLDLIERVRDRGAITLYLGTDDEDDQTSLAGRDLYPDVLGAARSIQNLRGHPYEFYQRVGFVVVGVIPDANGFGKPDILMARRVRLPH